ncbi:NAD-P-binding protein [Flagelloscypha sp. PMI_526]|nr:NAD-P-binding protein [Flagelloscypha sp. PMI_526]
MASTVNGKVIFNSIPQGYPEPGKTTVYDDSETIDLDFVALNGGVLVKTLVINIEPYFRGRMREAHIPSYVPAFPLGEPYIESGAVAVVLRSEKGGFIKGDHVTGVLPHREYSILTDGFIKVDNPHKLPWPLFLGLLGGPGKTAYAGWNKYSHAKPGDVVYINSASSAVGSVIVQLAKAQGLKVIGSAGSSEKVTFVKECGADVAFNYKEEDTAEECGMISDYNSTPYHVQNLLKIVEKAITISGFIHFRNLAEKCQGDISYGLEWLERSFWLCRRGENLGMAVVVVAED